MAKRKDVYPQFMSFRVVETAANTFTPVRIQLPVARRPGAKKITVIEVLNVLMDLNGESFLAADAVTVTLQFTTSATGQQLNNSNVWYFFRFAVTQLTSGTTIDYGPKEMRYDTGGGRGFLLATDSIFATVVGSSQTGAVTANFKLLYRFVEIGLEEYIGIVQQQSAQN